MRCSGFIKHVECTIVAIFADTTSDRSALRTTVRTIQPTDEGRSFMGGLFRHPPLDSPKQVPKCSAPFPPSEILQIRCLVYTYKSCKLIVRFSSRTVVSRQRQNQALQALRGLDAACRRTMYTAGFNNPPMRARTCDILLCI